VKGRVLAAIAVVAVVIVAAVVVFVLPTRGETLIVKKVLIDVEPAAVAGGVDREHVRGIVTETLADLRGIVVDETASDGHVLRVRVEGFTSSPPPSNQDDATASSSLALGVDVLEGAGRAVGRGHSVANARGVMSADALVSQALRDAVQQVLQARAADSLDSEVLLSWLTEPSTSDAQRKKAMQALSSRGERRATAPIVAVLETAGTDDEGNVSELAVAALQALSVLGDPDAIDAVITFSERQAPAVRKLCIDAVKATDDPRAVPWLFTMTWGHPDADVQAYARAALLGIAPDALGTADSGRVATGQGSTP